MTKFKIIAVTLSFVLAFSALFIGCKDGNIIDDPTPNNPSQQSASSSEPPTKGEPKKEIQVVDAFSESGKFTPSGADTEYSYEYRIPRIEDDSEDARKINKEIEDNFLPLAKKQIEQVKQDGYWDFLTINWRTEKSDDSISIIIKGDNGMSYVDYVTYCYNTETETRLTPEKLLEKFNLTKEEYLDGFVKSAQESFLKNTTKPTSDEDGLAEYNQVYESIPDYITFESVQPFIGEDGKLKAYVPVAQFNSGETTVMQLLTPAL